MRAADIRRPVASASARADDEGIGLVEVVVSMLILAMIAMAFLPILASNLKLSATSASITTASELADASLNKARGLASSCASIKALTTDPTDAGNGLKLATKSVVIPYVAGAAAPTKSTASSCPTSFPALVLVATWVTNVSTSKDIASSSTVIRVTG
jgi:Tfp pilus assembly protein PilV